ncbi:MAG: nuclear transport factor 2 family protein [Bacteroidota bacterium]|nr:nuclear transport factor 2 family protein [Bacteroidota bacterium]MDP3144219.1 nuclear transport factor 2 family protein [Bacteroidota bacterium]
MNNKELITKFYTSFAEADAEAMINCYDSIITFTDPAFGTLKGNDAKNMWRMLIEKSNGNLKIEFANVEANDKIGSANWTAVYLYGDTQRIIVNKISAKFEFENGKIIKHTDYFDLWKWTRQALGWKGYLFGYTSFMKKKIQKQASSLLLTYSSKQRHIIAK